MIDILWPDAATVTQGDLDISGLDALGRLHIYDRTTPEELPRRLEGMDAVVCNKTVFSADLLQSMPRLRYIGLFATGYNNIDIAAAKACGVTVCNAGEYSTAAVAQQVFALILAHTNRVAEYHAFVDQGGWVNSKTFSPFVFPLAELQHKVLGIVGYGSIGRQVARLAKAFDMQVLVHTRTPKEDADVSFVSLPQLLTQSDFITFHCPLTSQTQNMVDAKELAMLKPTAFLVNTARGGIVNEQALADALNQGVLAGAGVDVLETEPMAAHCPLLGAKNLLLTPHVAWAPIETRRRVLGVVEANLRAFLDGHPQNVVNP